MGPQQLYTAGMAACTSRVLQRLQASGLWLITDCAVVLQLVLCAPKNTSPVVFPTGIEGTCNGFELACSQIARQGGRLEGAQIHTAQGTAGRHALPKSPAPG